VRRCRTFSFQLPRRLCLASAHHVTPATTCPASRPSSPTPSPITRLSPTFAYHCRHPPLLSSSPVSTPADYSNETTPSSLSKPTPTTAYRSTFSHQLRARTSYGHRPRSPRAQRRLHSPVPALLTPIPSPHRAISTPPNLLMARQDPADHPLVPTKPLPMYPPSHLPLSPTPRLRIRRGASHLRFSLSPTSPFPPYRTTPLSRHCDVHRARKIKFSTQSRM
ncbi:hypothetical protein R3P38DRAFT_3025655, partial [Favolaschia claudopus]